MSYSNRFDEAGMWDDAPPADTIPHDVMAALLDEAEILRPEPVEPEPVSLPEPAPAPAGPLTVRPDADFLDARDGTHDTRPLTEHGNALRLFDRFGHVLRYLPERKAWLVWDDGRWLRSDGAAVRAMAAQLPEVIYLEGARHSRDGQHFARWSRKSQEARIVASAVSMLSDMPPLRLSVADLDADQMLCGLDGGRKVLDLRTGTVRPSVQCDHITKSLSVSGIGESAKASRWVRFMDEVTCGDRELSDWLQRFLGYSLSGSNAEQAFVFLFGHGANGKSVLTEAMQSLMGQYAAGIQPATLCDDKRTGAGPSPDLARLNGIRFAVAPEAEEGSRFAESMLKALVSGDTIPVRELNCAPFDMRPCLKLALTGNHKPTISGTDRGIWRRVRLVPFAASFEGKADPRLPEKLRAEFPHVLAWLAEGCMAWQERGLSDTPQAVAEATEAYRAESDTLGQWLSENCIRDEFARERPADLYADYQRWATASGITRQWTKANFGKRLSAYTLNGWKTEVKSSNGVDYRRGISLLNRGR